MYLESSYRSYVFDSKEEIIDFLKTVDENHAKLEVSVNVEDRGVNGEREIQISSIEELKDFLEWCPDDMQVNITIEAPERRADGKED